MSTNTIILNFLSVKSKPTAQAYMQSLVKLAEFLGCEMTSDEFLRRIEAMKGADAMEFAMWLRTYPAPDGDVIADATFSQRLHLLRRLFRYLVGMNMIERNVFDAVLAEIPKRQRRQKRPTKLIPTEKVTEMLALPNRHTRVGRRDFCLLALLFGGGLRVSEVCNLNCGDVGASANGTLFLLLQKTKNGETQRQSLPAWAVEAFAVLVSQRAGEGASNDDPLFCFYAKSGRARGRLSVETMRRLYKRYTEKVGLGKIPPHSARATAATLLKTMGFEDRDVAEFLRHSGVAMVKTYDKRIRSPETNAGLCLQYNKKETVEE